GGGGGGGEGGRRAELAWVAGDVDRDDRLRPLGDRCLDRGGIEVERPPVDVREHGDPALVHEAIRARGERVRRRDHLVSRSDAGRDTEQVESGGAGGDRGRVGRTHALRDELLEPVDRRPEREPARAKHLEDELLLPLAEVRPRERDPADLLPHARFVAGAYSSQWAHRSL